MGSPERLAQDLEDRRDFFMSPWERFQGYGVMGLPFASGHVLAFRRMTTSSIGPAYSSVWHRTPSGSWTIFVNVDPDLSCPRFFGRGADRVVTGDIEVSWEGPMRLSLRIPEHGLQWGMRLSSDLVTRGLSWTMNSMPEAALRPAGVLAGLGRLAGKLMGVGNMALSGRTPNGQRFRAFPRLLFRVEAAAAVVSGEDLGPVGPLETQARLGDFWIPNGGVFAIGSGVFQHVSEATEHNETPRGKHYVQREKGVGYEHG